MNLLDHFLKDDVVEAHKELKCAERCLALTYEELGKGNFDKAKQHSINALKSLDELTKMAEEKNRVDRLDTLIPGMPTVMSIGISRAMENE